MQTSRNYRRRLTVTVVLVLMLACAGLFVVNVGRVTAERGNPDAELEKSDLEASGSGAVTPIAGASPVGPLVKMVSALIIVIFCVYLGLYFLKRLMGSRYAGNGRGHLLEVIQTTCVGPKKTVALLRVADRSVLIGVTDNQISVLTQLDAEETEAILAKGTKAGEKKDFGVIFSAAAKKIRRLSLKRNPAAQEG